MLWITFLDSVAARGGPRDGLWVSGAILAILGFAMWRPRPGGWTLGVCGVAAAILLDGSLSFTLTAITGPALFFAATSMMLYPAPLRR